MVKWPHCRRAIRTETTCGTGTTGRGPLEEPMSFSLGNYFWLMLKRLEHSKLIPGLESKIFESKIFLFNFHNVFLLSKITHLKTCLFLSLSQLLSKIQKLCPAKILRARSSNCNLLASLPRYTSHFSGISVFVKASFMVKEKLDGIWLKSQEHTNSICSTETPRQKTHKEK